MKFSGYDMFTIDIANCYGLDKEEWLHRMLWTEVHYDELEDLWLQAKDKLLYRKAVHNFRLSELGFGTGHVMFLDATASGLQIMAVLSGCKKTAMAVNLIDNGKRNDVYQVIAEKMNTNLPEDQQVSRDGEFDCAPIKKPLMTHYYNKQDQSDVLSEAQEQEFYKVTEGELPGAEDVKMICNSYWSPSAMYHEWTLPNGHVAHVKVTSVVDARLEVDELDHTRFTYRYQKNQPSSQYLSLCPNIIHSIDAYIASEMVIRAKKLGFTLAHIFDAYAFHPNHGQQVIDLYKEILAEIAESNIFEDIISEIAGEPVQIEKDSEDLGELIRKSQYALS
jgi:DNA-directed RNA polymerase